jgi:hypothetical protein
LHVRKDHLSVEPRQDRDEIVSHGHYPTSLPDRRGPNRGHVISPIKTQALVGFASAVQAAYPLAAAGRDRDVGLPRVAAIASALESSLHMRRR